MDEEKKDRVIGVREWEEAKRKKKESEIISEALALKKKRDERERMKILHEMAPPKSLLPGSAGGRLQQMCARYNISESDCIRGLLRFHDKWRVKAKEWETEEKMRQEVVDGESS